MVFTYMSKHMKHAYNLSNQTKVHNTKKSIQMQTTNKINQFHGKFIVLSALRTSLKLKLFNFSHHHHSEITVHRGSMIDVIIPKDYLIIFYYGIGRIL